MHGKMPGSGLTEIISLICTSAIWGQYPVFSHPEFPQGSLWGVAAVWWLLDGRYSFPCWVPSGLTGSLSGGGCNSWRLWHSLFTDMAGNILFITYHLSDTDWGSRNIEINEDWGLSFVLLYLPLLVHCLLSKSFHIYSSVLSDHCH